MIDPAIIDLMHQMTRHPPAIVQEVPAVQPGAARVETWARTVGERKVRGLEQETERWISETERQMTGLVQAFACADVQPHHLAQLDRVIALNEHMLDGDAKAYERIVKRSRRVARKTRAVSPALFAIFGVQRERVLRSLSRWGIARSDFILVLRSLRAEYDPAGRDGPVFDDPASLGKYLRAVA